MLRVYWAQLLVPPGCRLDDARLLRQVRVGVQRLLEICLDAGRRAERLKLGQKNYQYYGPILKRRTTSECLRRRSHIVGLFETYAYYTYPYVCVMSWSHVPNRVIVSDTSN